MWDEIDKYGSEDSWSHILIPDSVTNCTSRCFFKVRSIQFLCYSELGPTIGDYSLIS